jgi:phage tail sheath protein FI
LTGSYDNVSVTQTAQDFSNRGVNSSFAAAYFPDVNIRLDNGVVYEKMPPSVVVFGVYGNNDTVGQVFNAPAGYTRARLGNVTDFAAVIDTPNADTLYVTSINPLLSKPGVGPVVWGQKTTLAKESLLNRVNVRRLLIAIRREVRAVGNQFMFEPAREETLKAFNAAVQPIMQRYQAAGGVQKYKVVIDASTTTQADLDNKTLRGKIFLIPTTSLEFLSIDFVVTNRENFVG